jgi:hypothetical protein
MNTKTNVASRLAKLAELTCIEPVTIRRLIMLAGLRALANRKSIRCPLIFKIVDDCGRGTARRQKLSPKAPRP